MDRFPFERSLSDGMGGAPDLRRKNPADMTPEEMLARQLQLLEMSRRRNERHDLVQGLLLEAQLKMIGV